MIAIFYVFYFSIFIIFVSHTLNNRSNKIVNDITYLVGALVVSFYFSTRNVNLIDDAIVYMDYFREYDGVDSLFNSNFSWKGDYFFFALGVLIKLVTQDPEVYIRLFYFLNTIAFFIAVYLVSLRYNTERNAIVLCFILVSSSFYFMYGNVVRQGLSFCIFLFFWQSISKNTSWSFWRLISLLILGSAAYYSHKAILVIIISVCVIHIFRHRIKPVENLVRFQVILILSSALLSMVTIKLLTLLPGGFYVTKLIAYSTGAGAEDATLKIVLSTLLCFAASYLINSNKGKRDGYLSCSNLYSLSLGLLASTVNLATSIALLPFGKIATRFLLFTDLYLAIALSLLLSCSFGSLFSSNRVTKLIVLSFTSILMFAYSIYFFSHDAIISVLTSKFFIGIL